MPAAASPQAYTPELEYVSGHTRSATSGVGGEYLRASSFSVGSTNPSMPSGVGGNSNGVGAPSVEQGVPLGNTALCEVLDVQGNSVTVGSLANGAQTHCVFVFAPRDAVEVSALVYAKVAHLLHASGTRLVFVTAWLPHQARKFLVRFERVSPFPGALVCDPDAVLFGRFGLVRSRLGAWAALARTVPKRASRGSGLGRDIAATRTPSARLRAGAVVVRLPTALEACDASGSSLGSGARLHMPGPRIVYHRAETVASGAACHMDVLAIVGANGAFVPDIDAAHLYRRFNNMRITSLKARQADAKEQKAQRERANKLVSAPPRTRTSRQRTWHG